MTDNIRQWPALALMEDVRRWAKSAASDAFWQTRTEHDLLAKALAQASKSLVVWLELKGQESAAAELDGAMGRFRAAVWDFGRACVGVYPPDDGRCRDTRERMLEEAERVAGACEDVDSEVPRGMWEGFPDE